MHVVATSNDQIRLNFLAALLADAGIGSVLLDQHVSAVEGGIGAFPRRLAVTDADEARARRVLREAGEP
jgi:Putative prokaryotic signal transducing protein